MDESDHLTPPDPDAPPARDDTPAPEPSAESRVGHEIEDDGPLPVLDPAVDERVRALLSATADTGPMPSGVVDRIAAALADEARLRVGPGPLPAAGAGSPAVADMSGGTVVPLPARRQRPWVAVAAVAAAVAVVAGGASVLHVTQRPNPSAVVVGDTSSRTPTPTTSSPSPTSTSPHIQVSTTDYDAATLPAKARELLDHPGTPLPELAAEAPSLGPIATPVGLQSCLDALGVGPADVSVDLATFGGRPAAIIVVTANGTSTALAVERSCSPGNVTGLADATPVP